jgi:hypothetical protein
MTIVVKPVQSPNTPLPKDVAEESMLIDFKPVQPLKLL